MEHPGKVKPHRIPWAPAAWFVMGLALAATAVAAPRAFAETSAPLEVNAVKGLAEFPDPMAVVGKVFKTNHTQRLFSMTDRSACGSCPTPDCETFTLPVKWDGEMPKRGTVVLVRGAVKPVDGKRFFVAQSVTPVDQ